MKRFLTVFVAIAISIPALAQTPQNIAASRWILPGFPRISDIASTADGKATKTIWFTARDSGGIGTMTIPKGCVPATFTEYHPPMLNVGPSQLAFAEKAFQVQDTAKKKPAKYKPQVWYVDGYQPAGGPGISGNTNLYALTPPAQKGGPMGWLLYQMPNIPVNVAFTIGVPFTLQWSAATKPHPAALWFIGYNQYPTPYNYLYSFVPQKKPTAPYGAVVTKYSFPNLNQNITAVRVEDGLIWTTGIDGNGATWLNMIPAGGTGNGLRWSILPNTNPGAIPQILPVYTSRKQGKGLMPNQVWIKYQSNLFVIGMASSMDSMVVDTVYYTGGPNPQRLYTSLGADNKSKADTGKNVIVFTEGPPQGGNTWTTNMSFLKAGVGNPGMIRHGITASTQTEIISAITVPNLQSYTLTVQPSCITGAPTYGLSMPWLKSEWDFFYTGMFQNLTAPFYTNVRPVGAMDTKKFDLVFSQVGGDSPLGSNPSDPTINHITGTFSKPPKAGTAPETDFDPDFENTPETDGEADATEAVQPEPFKLYQAFPNPFNPSTTIQFSIPADAHVSLSVYNTLGQQVASLVDEQRQAGIQSVQWNASNLPSGVYFYRIIAGGFTDMKMMMLVK